MKKLLGLVCAGSLLLLSGCNWYCNKGTGTSSFCADHASECPCGMKDCHCPTGKCTCEKTSLTAAASASTAQTSVVAVNTAKEFEETVLNAKKPVVAKFGAPWCGACRDMKPVFEKVAKEMGDKYIFADVDIDKVASVAKDLGITGIPVFIFFENGKEAKGSKRIVGSTSQEAFKHAVNENFGD